MDETQPTIAVKMRSGSQVHEVPPLKPLPRMTEEERQQCLLGSRVKSIYARQRVDPNIRHMRDPLGFLKYVERHIIHQLTEELIKEEFFHVFYEPPIGGLPTEIRIWFMGVPKCPESKGVIEQNMELNARIYRAVNKELAVITVLKEARDLLRVAPSLMSETCKSYSDDFYACARKIDEALERCKLG